MSYGVEFKFGMLIQVRKLFVIVLGLMSVLSTLKIYNMNILDIASTRFIRQITYSHPNMQTCHLAVKQLPRLGPKNCKKYGPDRSAKATHSSKMQETSPRNCQPVPPKDKSMFVIHRELLTLKQEYQSLKNAYDALITEKKQFLSLSSRALKTIKYLQGLIQQTIQQNTFLRNKLGLKNNIRMREEPSSVLRLVYKNNEQDKENSNISQNSSLITDSAYTFTQKHSFQKELSSNVTVELAEHLERMRFLDKQSGHPWYKTQKQQPVAQLAQHQDSGSYDGISMSSKTSIWEPCNLRTVDDEIQDEFGQCEMQGRLACTDTERYSSDLNYIRKKRQPRQDRMSYTKTPFQK